MVCQTQGFSPLNIINDYWYSNTHQSQDWLLCCSFSRLYFYCPLLLLLFYFLLFSCYSLLLAVTFLLFSINSFVFATNFLKPKTSFSFFPLHCTVYFKSFQFFIFIFSSKDFHYFRLRPLRQFLGRLYLLSMKELFLTTITKPPEVNLFWETYSL